jgi:hypothetical protein
MRSPKTQRAAGGRLEGKTGNGSDQIIAQRAAVLREIERVRASQSITPLRKAAALAGLEMVLASMEVTP